MGTGEARCSHCARFTTYVRWMNFAPRRWLLNEMELDLGDCSISRGSDDLKVRAGSGKRKKRLTKNKRPWSTISPSLHNPVCTIHRGAVEQYRFSGNRNACVAAYTWRCRGNYCTLFNECRNPALGHIVPNYAPPFVHTYLAVCRDLALNDREKG